MNLMPYIETFVWLAIMALATWSSTRSFLTKLTRAEKFAATIIISLLFSSWLTYGLWFIFGQQWGTSAARIIAAVLIVRDLRWYRTFTRFKLAPLLIEALRRHRTQSLLLLICISSATLLAYNYAFPVKEGAFYSSGPSWGDTVLHTSLASYFAENGVRTLALPVYPQAPLSYPFLIDLHLGLLYYLSSSWQASLFWPTFALLSSLALLWYRIGVRLTKSRLGASIWTSLIFFSGSAGGILLLLQHASTSFPAQIIDYTNVGNFDAATQLYMANITTSELLPQRTYLIGANLVFLIILLLISHFPRVTTKPESHVERRLAYFVAIIVGLMPFAHVHSFFVIGLILICFVASRWMSKRKPPRIWLRAAGISLAISAPQVYWQFSNSFTSSFSRWHFGWLTATNNNVLSFWFLNLGLLLPAIAIGAWWANKRQSTTSWQRLLALAGLILFIASNVYVFQPYIWDNMKFISYAYMLVLLPLCSALPYLWRKGTIQKIAIATSLIIILIPGFLSVSRQVIVWDKIFTAEDVAVAEHIKQSTAADATFLTAPKHNMPVAALAGRKIVLGYTGWLWTYGIDFSQTEIDTRKILAGDPQSPELLNKYSIDYIAITNDQAAEYDIDINVLNQRYTPIYQDAQWHVYQVNKS